MDDVKMLSPEEAAYKEAFDQAIEKMEQAGKSPSSTHIEPVEDSSFNNENNDGITPEPRLGHTEWDDKEDAQQQAAHEEETTPEPVQPKRRGRPRKEEPSVDTKEEYEKLYSEYKQNAEAQLGLYRGRVQQLAQELRELKAQQEQKKAEPETLPDEVKEVFEMYPDIGKAVSAYVQAQLNNTKQSLVKDVEQQIQPIKSHLVLSDVQKHQMAIEAAHPDLKNILSSGDLLRWMDELPPVMKAGAKQVYQFGDTESVISLLDDYKTSRGISSGRRSKRNAQPERHVGQQSGSSLRETPSGTETSGRSERSGVGVYSPEGTGPRGTGSSFGSVYSEDYQGKGEGEGVDDYSDDPLVQRVMAALAVKSNKAPVNLNNTPRQQTKTAEDIFKEVTRDWESNHRRPR